MNRSARAALAAETVRIVDAGRYEPDGRVVTIDEATRKARRGSHMHLPDDPELSVTPSRGRDGRVEVTGETTLAAAQRLFGEGHAAIACLNFASAKHPGGGFLGGSQAQEESLARSSALVACLQGVPEYYDFHRRQSHPVYSDRVICSPRVPVFRTDDGGLLSEPYEVTILTAAAPNAGALANRNWSGDLRSVIRERARRVLSAAVVHDQRTLVLGAWGCGVFRNDPVVVAGAFAELIEGDFLRAFDHITFAVLDNAHAAPTRAAFERRLHGLTRS